MTYKNILRASFTPRLFFVFGIIALFFFIVIGSPTPPGYMYKASEAYLQSLPGYNDIKTGSINPNLLADNVDSYNQYLLAVILVIIINIVGSYALYVLASVLVWHYLQKGTLSTKRFWKVFWTNLVWFIVVIPLSFVVYFVLSILASYLPLSMSQIFFALLMALFVVKVMTFTQAINYHLVGTGSLTATIQALGRVFTSKKLQLFVGMLLFMFFVFAVSLLGNLPGVTLQLTLVLVILAQLLGFAWLHQYVAVVLADKSSK